jgi:hypothetical protein
MTKLKTSIITDRIRTQVFAHKGVVGIQSDFGADGLLNDPSKPGQMGFVVDAAHEDIHPDALEVLKKVNKSADDIGDVDVFKTDDGRVIFAWMGGPLAIIRSDSGQTGSNSYDPSLLTANESVVADPKFVNFVDAHF